MTAHNLPIWRFLVILQEMTDQGFIRMDVTIEDDLTIVIKGIKEEDQIKKNKNKTKNIDWEDTI